MLLNSHHLFKQNLIWRQLKYNKEKCSSRSWKMRENVSRHARKIKRNISYLGMNYIYTYYSVRSLLLMQRYMWVNEVSKLGDTWCLYSERHHGGAVISLFSLFIRFCWLPFPAKQQNSLRLLLLFFLLNWTIFIVKRLIPEITKCSQL